MNQGRIVITTGVPGTGKTTAASVVAKESGLAKIYVFDTAEIS